MFRGAPSPLKNWRFCQKSIILKWLCFKNYWCEDTSVWVHFDQQSELYELATYNCPSGRFLRFRFFSKTYHKMWFLILPLFQSCNHCKLSTWVIIVMWKQTLLNCPRANQPYKFICALYCHYSASTNVNNFSMWSTVYTRV